MLLANDAFSPSDDEVQWARCLLAPYEEAGGVTIGLDGQMVDEVVAARARAILVSANERR